jgi:hypothetical protein
MRIADGSEAQKSHVALTVQDRPPPAGGSVKPDENQSGWTRDDRTTGGPGTPEMARHPSAGVNLRGAQKTQECCRAPNARKEAIARCKGRPARSRMSGLA